MADTNMSENPQDGVSSDGSSITLAVMGTPAPQDGQDVQDVQNTYHETGIFQDFNDTPEIVAEEMEECRSDGDTTIDNDSGSDSDSDSVSDFEDDDFDEATNTDHEPITHGSPELGNTTSHLDQVVNPLVPLADAPHNKPTSFINLLESSYAPGRGTFDVEFSLQHGEAEVKCLEKEERRIRLLLKEAKEYCQETRQELEHSNQAFKNLQDQNGISQELWQEYEAFCESLEPQFGCRGGWSILCFEDHKNSYMKYDPDLTLFTESAECPFQSCNFRCEAYTIVPNSPDVEYVVEFWPIASPVPRTGTEKTWGEQYPNLYRLATRALYNFTRPDTQAASELLRSLPDSDAPFSGGWLFQYQPEKKRASHPVLSRRWTYRSAHKINGNGPRPAEEEEEYPITDEDAAKEPDIGLVESEEEETSNIALELEELMQVD